LIPIYQPKALNNYMANSESHAPPVPSTGSISVGPGWPHYMYSQGYPYPPMPLAQASDHRFSEGMATWAQNPVFFPYQPLANTPYIRTPQEVEAQRPGAGEISSNYATRIVHNPKHQSFHRQNRTNAFGRGRYNNHHRFGNRQRHGDPYGNNLKAQSLSDSPHGPSSRHSQFSRNAWE
jgi:hypothetical protein